MESENEKECCDNGCCGGNCCSEGCCNDCCKKEKSYTETILELADEAWAELNVSAAARLIPAMLFLMISVNPMVIPLLCFSRPRFAKEGCRIAMHDEQPACIDDVHRHTNRSCSSSKMRCSSLRIRFSCSFWRLLRNMSHSVMFTRSASMSSLAFRKDLFIMSGFGNSILLPPYSSY